MYKIVTEGEITTANSTRGRKPKGSVAVVAFPWSLSDLETTQDILAPVPYRFLRSWLIISLRVLYPYAGLTSQWCRRLQVHCLCRRTSPTK